METVPHRRDDGGRSGRDACGRDGGQEGRRTRAQDGEDRVCRADSGWERRYVAPFPPLLAFKTHLSFSTVPQTLPPSTRILSHLRDLHLDPEPPFHLTFTVSPAWLKKAGTVALGLPGAGARGRIGGREGAGWRPSSLFGGLWGGETTKEVAEEEDSVVTEEPTVAELASEGAEKIGADDQDDEDDTLKGQKANATATPASLSGSTAGGGGRTRLSALFTDWIAPEATTSTNTLPSPSPVPASPAKPHARIVGQPVAMSKDLSRRCSSFTPGDRLSVIHSAGSFMEQDEDDEEGGEEEEEDINAALEQLMVSLS